MPDPSNWITVSESLFAWEREALEFIRTRFPRHEPYRAWSNFEFIADDGSLNEVDLLVFTPQGFFLIEIKSRPGSLSGDAGAWIWEKDGRRRITDNPLFAANAKAKRLRSLLERQQASRHKDRLPFLEALVFCSDPALQCKLEGNAAFRVCLRDREAGSQPARPGIIAAIQRRECPGLDAAARGTHDRVVGRVIAQSMDQAGIRPSQRSRKVSDYQLAGLLEEGPGYQDWAATHVQVDSNKRRVRRYLVRTQASLDDRQTIRRAALREFQLLELLHHPGVLRAYHLSEDELGPILIFEHDSNAVRLDHYLAERKGALSMDVRLSLMRQLAEAIRFAHEKGVVHRALCPQSILITAPDTSNPRLKIYNWQAGYRTGTGTSSGAREVTPTSHADRLVQTLSTAYMAPEALADEGILGEYLDIFSLGAIAYHLFSDEPPAASGLELSARLRETQGLRISSVLNGASEALQFLIQFSTHPTVPDRIASATDFLGYLDQVEEELTAPDPSEVPDPSSAKIGDLLPGGFTVLKRLGQGATSVGLLVERGAQEFVLKIANSPEHNDRVKSEAEVLQKLRHPHIVEHRETVQIGDRVGFLMRPVLVDREKRTIETLGHRIRQGGALHVDLLQRFGEDLLSVVTYLSDQGIAHRDIKPDNIVLGKIGQADSLGLVLFDFSLSRTAPDNILAGTRRYLDPLLPLRSPPRWDLHAERYAAAITLHELATGAIPKWGDGVSNASHLDVEITIEPESFDIGLRESLPAFFRKALRRNPAERFDNAEEMLRSWRRCFEAIPTPGQFTHPAGEDDLRSRLSEATLETPIAALGLGARSTNVLDRSNILTVADLLATPPQRLNQLRGVGHQTRREIVQALNLLRDQLGAAPVPAEALVRAAKTENLTGADNLSIDLLVDRISRTGARDGESAQRIIQALLSPESGPGWPSQADVARALGVTRARIGAVVGPVVDSWSREPSLTSLRKDIVGLLEDVGGVMTPSELADALLLTRGSVAEHSVRTTRALAAARAAAEVERIMTAPRFTVSREGGRAFIALAPVLGAYAGRLGDAADHLADEDPLAAPERVMQRLRSIAFPPGQDPISDARLLRLAVAASSHAALSSRQELYPRNMDSRRALRLAALALSGVPRLTVQQIQDRVSSRYPSATPLPPRPELDIILEEVSAALKWDPTSVGPNGDHGAYVAQAQLHLLSEGSTSTRFGAAPPSGEEWEVSPEIADARQFQARLERALKEGSFLAIVVDPRRYEQASRDLSLAFSVPVINFEALFLHSLRQEAEKAGASWEVVLKADAKPRAGDWNNLMTLVNRAMKPVAAQLRSATQPMLLTYTGLLARYDQLPLLETLRDAAGRRGGIPAVWVLTPGDGAALLEGKPLPLLAPGQQAKLPRAWPERLHR